LLRRHALSLTFVSCPNSATRRYGCDLAKYPNILAIEKTCLAVKAFADAAPEKTAGRGMSESFRVTSFGFPCVLIAFPITVWGN
jgi:hypothetical protein